MRPKIDTESLGIRLREVNRQRAVDRALDRLRHGLHADWHYLTTEEHGHLRWILGELWSVSSREQWDGYHFSKLDLQHTRRLVMLAERMRGLHARGIGSIEAAVSVVTEVSGRAESPAGSRVYQPGY